MCQMWWCIHVSKVWKYLQKIVKTRRKIVSGYPHAFFAGEFHSFLFVSNQLNSLWIPFSTETSGTFFKVICWPIDVVWIIGFTFPSGFRIVLYLYVSLYHVHTLLISSSPSRSISDLTKRNRLKQNTQTYGFNEFSTKSQPLFWIWFPVLHTKQYIAK